MNSYALEKSLCPKPWLVIILYIWWASEPMGVAEWVARAAFWANFKSWNENILLLKLYRGVYGI